MNKIGSGTLWGTFIAIIVTMALFYGTFNYVSVNYENSGISNTTVYDHALSDLNETQFELDANIEQVRGKLENVSEASTLAAVAWNGLTGVAATLSVFFGVIQIGIDVFNAILPGLSFLPDWAKTLINMAIVIWLVLIILGAFKGESKT